MKEYSTTCPLTVFPHKIVNSKSDWPLLNQSKNSSSVRQRLRKCHTRQEEEESLVEHIKGLKQIRFWMTFSDNYIKHLTVLKNVGMTSIEPINYEGKQIIPIQFLKAILPDPASLGPLTKGKTCIGCLITGKLKSTGETATKFIYNVCDHQECYVEVKSQAISYTAGVPAMIGARQLMSGAWLKPGVWNVEQLDPDPYMADLNTWGLPWQVIDAEPLVIP